jgi:hypothetical protein
MIGSRSVYDFEYNIIYDRAKNKNNSVGSGGNADVDNAAATKSVAYQLPSMSMYSLQMNGDRVYIKMTDNEEEPLQTIIYKKNVPIGSDVLFRIQIDQFNAECLEDFVLKTPRGRAMCIEKDYSFASIFDTAAEVGLQACMSATQSLKGRNTTKKPPDRTSPITTTTTTTTATATTATTTATATATPSTTTLPLTAVAIAADTSTSTDTGTSPVENELVSADNSSSKVFMTKYWYVFLIGAIALIAIIIGIFIMTSASIARNKQMSGLSPIPNASLNVQYLQPPRSMQPMTLRSPILKPFGLLPRTGKSNTNALDDIMSL